MLIVFQVRADPAGDGDAEGGRELLQRADQGADQHVQEQVHVLCPSDVHVAEQVGFFV